MEQNDISCTECCQLTFLPFYLMYKGIRRLGFVTYRAIRESVQTRKCNEIIKSQKLSNAVYKRFYMYWKEESNTYIIIHVRPPCFLDKRVDIVSVLNELMTNNREDKPIHFVVTHVNSPNDITCTLIQSLKKAAITLNNPPNNTIIVMHSLYDDLWNTVFINQDCNICLIKDMFDVKLGYENK